MAELTLPKMGESVMEARIIRWLKKPGDRVEADEPVLEIATDKVDSEVPSPVRGILAEIRVKEGETVPVGTVLASITEEGAAVGAVTLTGGASASVTPVEMTSASWGIQRGDVHAGGDRGAPHSDPGSGWRPVLLAARAHYRPECGPYPGRAIQDFW